MDRSDVQKTNWDFVVGDNAASRVGDLFWFGPFKPLAKAHVSNPNGQRLYYGKAQPIMTMSGIPQRKKRLSKNEVKQNGEDFLQNTVRLSKSPLLWSAFNPSPQVLSINLSFESMMFRAGRLRILYVSIVPFNYLFLVLDRSDLPSGGTWSLYRGFIEDPRGDLAAQLYAFLPKDNYLLCLSSLYIDGKYLVLGTYLFASALHNTSSNIGCKFDGSMATPTYLGGLYEMTPWHLGWSLWVWE